MCSSDLRETWGEGYPDLSEKEIGGGVVSLFLSVHPQSLLEIHFTDQSQEQ